MTSSLPPQLSKVFSVSVVVACHNAEATVEQTVDSILSNARPGIRLQVIVVDDYSTDRSRDCLERFGDRIHLIGLAENVGVSQARNIGIAAATGDFIAFCDADDLWEPDKLNWQLPLFQDPEVGLVCSDFLWFDGLTGLPVKARADRRCFKRGWAFRDLLFKNFVGTSTTILRRQVTEDFRFDPDIGYSEDFDLWLRISRRWKIDYVDRELVRYRLSSTQLSHNWVAMQESRMRIISEHLQNEPNGWFRKRIRARALFNYAMEHWDSRDFPAARKLFLAATMEYPFCRKYWLRLILTTMPIPLLVGLLKVKNKKQNASGVGF